MAPYLVTKANNEVNLRQFNDLNPKLNELPLVAQILTKNADQFLTLADKLVKIGINKINLNMGCPYPMVANRTKGSGLLPHPDKIYKLLEQIITNSPCHFSVKLRIGRDNPDEILSIIPILNELKIDDITIHPRIGRQLYKGVIDINKFRQCVDLLPTPPTYNGDINSIEDFKKLKSEFPMITKWMIGRGALKNPALFSIIKGEHDSYANYKVKLQQMHDLLCDGYLNQDNGKSNFLNKMKGHWLYIANAFENEAKVFKKIKKSQNINHYFDAVEWIFTNNSGKF
jgi:tRNA-dihydrouridine synthase